MKARALPQQLRPSVAQWLQRHADLAKPFLQRGARQRYTAKISGVSRPDVYPDLGPYASGHPPCENPEFTVGLFVARIDSEKRSPNFTDLLHSFAG